MSPSSPVAAPVDDQTIANPPAIEETKEVENEQKKEDEKIEVENIKNDDETVEPPSETVPNLDALVAELRASLASTQTLLSTQATRLSTLTDLETEHGQLKDQYAFLAAAKEAVEKQLHEETARREAAEENVEMLRGQVEQARRGVGILQKQEKERKRLSLLPSSGSAMGLLGTGGDSEEVLSEPKEATSRANKRSSMLVGRTHRRQSSQSESADVGGPSIPSNLSPNLNAPRSGGLRELRLGSGNTPVTTNISSSPTTATTGFFDDSAPLPVPPSMTQRASSTSITSQPISEASATEESRLRAELAAVKAKLAIAEESRDASEAGMRALREFMAGGGIEGGAAEEDLLKTLRLPPLPTDREADDMEPDQPEQSGKKAWSFKLWKQAGLTSPSLSTAVEPPATPNEKSSPVGSILGGLTPKKGSPLPTPGEQPTENVVNSIPSASTPLGNFVSGWTKNVIPGTPVDGKPVAARALSSFFSRKKDGSKDKDLPNPPEVASGETEDKTDEELKPSPQIADKVVQEDEVAAKGDTPEGEVKEQVDVEDKEVVDKQAKQLQEISLNDPVDEEKK